MLLRFQGRVDHLNLLVGSRILLLVVKSLACAADETKPLVKSQAYQTEFVRSQHAPYKYSNFLANRYCKYLSFLKSAFTAVYLQ